MALLVRRFHHTIDHLFRKSFIEAPVGAQLISGNYVYSASHKTRLDFAGNFVGTPIDLTGKTITVNEIYDTLLDCNDLNWSAQGVLSARYVLFHFWAGSGEGISTDEVILLIDLDTNGSEIEIATNVGISIGGILRIPFDSTSSTVDRAFGFEGDDTACGFASVKDL